MHVSAISNQNFTASKKSRENIDRFIQLDDSQIRMFAIEQAQKKAVKKEKHWNRLYYSVPLIALGAKALTNGGAPLKILGKEISGKAANLTRGLGAGAFWAFLLGTTGIVNGVNKKIEEKNPKYEKFNRNHPLLSVLGECAVIVGVCLGGPKLAQKLLTKLGPKTLDKMGNTVSSIAEKINTAKAPNFFKKVAGVFSKAGKKSAENVAQAAENAAESVTQQLEKEPSKLAKFFSSDGVKFAIGLTPIIALFGSALGSIFNTLKFKRDANNIYADIKDTQQRITVMRLEELKAAAGQAEQI